MKPASLLKHEAGREQCLTGVLCRLASRQPTACFLTRGAASPDWPTLYLPPTHTISSVRVCEDAPLLRKAPTAQAKASGVCALGAETARRKLKFVPIGGLLSTCHPEGVQCSV